MMARCILLAGALLGRAAALRTIADEAAELLNADAANAPIVYSLDASPGLADHAFSAVASLSSIVHAARNASALRFAFILTVPERSVGPFAEALCAAIVAAGGARMHRGSGVPFCARRSLAALLAREPGCATAAAALPARVTFVHFPQSDAGYPPRVRRVLELLCCAQRRYRVDRPELATSLGNHARFFAYLALLPLGCRRAVFLDVDTLAHHDLADLVAAPLTEARFVAAARRCAPKRAAYKPRFRFRDALVSAMGLRSEKQHVNAGVLVIDLERYCAADVVGNLDAVLVRHLQHGPLWHQGNNQPPFTVAAAKHTLFVHPSWNVRPGDARAEQAVARVHRRHGNAAKDECADMIHEAPRILHAHFRPCDALPPRLCPMGSSPARDPATKNLKLAVAQLLKATKRTTLPCSCKGRHFDDLAPAEAPDAALPAPRGGFPAERL